MFEDINTFCVIAKHQSFSKAAREVGVSTPVITRRLARLEDTLQTRLLNRTTRRVTLTEAGNLFYAEVTEILQALEASKDSVKSLMSQVAGTLKVAMPTPLSQGYVIPHLKKFMEQYPNLKINIVTGGNLLPLLHNGYDLVIQCGNMPDSSYYYKKLGIMKKIICAAPEYLKKCGVPKVLEDLKNHNCLLPPENLFQTWKVLDKNKVKEITVNGTIQTTDYMDLKRLAVDGLGIIYAPEYTVHEELKSGKLVSVLDNYQPYDHTLYAIYPTKKYLAKKTQLFLDFVQCLLENVCQRNCG